MDIQIPLLCKARITARLGTRVNFALVKINTAVTDFYVALQGPLSHTLQAALEAGWRMFCCHMLLQRVIGREHRCRLQAKMVVLTTSDSEIAYRTRVSFDLVHPSMMVAQLIRGIEACVTLSTIIVQESTYEGFPVFMHLGDVRL